MDGEGMRIGARTAAEIISSTGNVSRISAFAIATSAAYAIVTTATSANLPVPATSLLTVHNSTVVTGDHVQWVSPIGLSPQALKEKTHPD